MIVKFDLGNYKPIKYNYNENQKSYFDWLPNEILQIICDQLSFRKIKYLHLMYSRVKFFEDEYKRLKNINPNRMNISFAKECIEQYNNLIGLIALTIRYDWSAGSDIKGRVNLIIYLLNIINTIIENYIEKLKNQYDKQLKNREERKEIYNQIKFYQKILDDYIKAIEELNEDGIEECCFDGRSIQYYDIPYGGDKKLFKDGPLFDEYKEWLDEYKDDLPEYS